MWCCCAVESSTETIIVRSVGPEAEHSEEKLIEPMMHDSALPNFKASTEDDHLRKQSPRRSPRTQSERDEQRERLQAQVRDFVREALKGRDVLAVDPTSGDPMSDILKAIGLAAPGNGL
eukprot:TRINITY_DN13471_c0_g1_i3.p2 TRINITY_DN13471_c0_g1~~TRINITY_DN13471_c0_g1_i3.p2  ORF type:complete len:119 (+),score=27.37 TRINITY_DN13471_c0_g1_i3:119-475(+)